MKRIVVMISLLGAFASYVFAQCPTPNTDTCRFLHPGMGVTLTGYCVNDDCLEMSYGAESRILAIDESGKTWLDWHEGRLIPSTAVSCVLYDSGSKKRVKTRLELPETPNGTSPSCSVDLQLGLYVYHEHFAGDPANKCVGWMECREDRVP